MIKGHDNPRSARWDGEAGIKVRLDIDYFRTYLTQSILNVHKAGLSLYKSISNDNEQTIGTIALSLQ